jgi:eukaryotic-like serine/threonine-protein kinase
MLGCAAMRPTGEGARLPDRYHWTSQAGRGGMGVVHQALDRQTGAQVAVKILHSRGAVELARFEQEAKVLAELSHPAIVRYFDHGTTLDGAPYIAMEWLDGETLEDRLLRGRLAPGEVARIGHLVLGALAAAHSRDIVHRDIKPGNIFLVKDGPDDVRVLDFGIARRRLDIKRFTRDGNTVGTPLYTSPEQARGRADVDGRADIFSLGCVLFEALTGEPPFTGDSPLEVMARVCAGRPTDLDAKRPGLPAGMSALVRSMLAPEPVDRPQSAAALAAELATYASATRGERPSLGRLTQTPSTGERVVVAMLVSVGKPARGDAGFAAVVRALAERSACVMDRLIDRSLLLTAACPSLEEQAHRLASLALAVRNLYPGARAAIATGRTAVIGHLPVGVLMERLPRLLRASEPDIVVDESTRRLLPEEFGMTLGPSGYVLHSVTAEAPAAPAPLAEDGREPATPPPTPLPHCAPPSLLDG